MEAPELELSPVTLRSYFRLVQHNRNFRRLWCAQIVSEIGDCLLRFLTEKPERLDQAVELLRQLYVQLRGYTGWTDKHRFLLRSLRAGSRLPNSCWC